MNIIVMKIRQYDNTLKKLLKLNIVLKISHLIKAIIVLKLHHFCEYSSFLGKVIILMNVHQCGVKIYHFIGNPQKE